MFDAWKQRQRQRLKNRPERTVFYNIFATMMLVLAVELLMALGDKYEGFVIFNRTFMHINEPIIRQLAKEGKVLRDEATGSVMAFGNRFLEKRSVQIAMMGGDYDKCIAWAIKVGLEKGVPQVVTEVPLDDEALGQVFADHGFKAAAELQVMSGPAC